MLLSAALALHSSTFAAYWKWSERGFIDVAHSAINQNGHKAVTASCATTAPLFCHNIRLQQLGLLQFGAKFGGSACRWGPLFLDLWGKTLHMAMVVHTVSSLVTT